MSTRNLKAALLLATAMIASPAFAGKGESGGPDTRTGSAAERAQAKILFGDLHMHTAYSFDAYLFKTTATPDEAYRFALGEQITSSTGVKARLARPLDFLVITDHAENLGLAPAIAESNPALLANLSREIKTTAVIGKPTRLKVNQLITRWQFTLHIHHENMD